MNKESSPDKKNASFTAREPQYDMANLVFPPSVMEQMASLKARFDCHRLVYETWGLGEIDPAGRHIAFNMYGPSGTGKTSGVEAFAKLWGKKIIDVNYAEIESKYVGETGKNITAAFRAAKEQDAVLFFDEADSILGRRMTDVTQAADQAVNVARAVMLKELDAFDGIVAFATNLAANIDSAFVRRIPYHIEVPLPDRAGRLAILRKLVPSKVPFRDKIDLESLAGASEGLSGGDLKNVVANAICELAAQDWANMPADGIRSVFARQLASVAAAKRAVGTGFGSPVTQTVTTETIPIGEARKIAAQQGDA